MSGFDPTTPVTFTIRDIPLAIWFVIAAAVAVIGSGAIVVWVVVSFTIGGMRDDVKSVRESVQSLQVADKASAVSLRDVENRLADRIASRVTTLLVCPASSIHQTPNLMPSPYLLKLYPNVLRAIGQLGPGEERRRRR